MYQHHELVRVLLMRHIVLVLSSLKGRCFVNPYRQRLDNADVELMLSTEVIWVLKYVKSLT